MRSSSPAADLDSDPQQISAYYSLIFPNFTFYLQTINCTIGRKTAVGSSSGAGRVDVDLGPLKSVSRLHARIEYDSDIERFVLVVIGRNGAWVDGVWASAGSRVPLGEHSQIQIASRTFHFTLPPAPPQPIEEEPLSPTRSRSPSLIDVTTELPRPETPPPLPPSPPKAKPVAVPKPAKSSPTHALPNTNSIKPKQNPNSKRYLKQDPEERPRPEDIPPKPSLTYAQLIYRALKGIGGKATLQEICTWVSDTYEYYKWADPQWMSSIRHNLSSGRAFKKLERCGGDRGKGFFWTLDEDQDLAALEGESKSSEAKQKKGKVADQKRNGAKLDANGSYSLPPPLTTRPLEFKIATPKAQATSNPDLTAPPMASLQPPSTNDATNTSYTPYPQPNLVLGAVKSEYSGTPLSVPNPYAPRQTNGNGTTTPGWHYTAPIPITPQVIQPSQSNSSALPASTRPSFPSTSSSSKAQAQATVSQFSDSISFLDKDARVPIIVGLPPASYQPPQQATPPSTSGSPPSTVPTTTIPPMLLHESTIYLAPEMFSSLDRQALDAIEALGVQQALELLRGHLARFLKQKMGKRSRGEKKKKPKLVNAEKSGGNVGLFTTGPLAARPGQPQAINGDTNVTNISKDADEDEIVVVDDSDDSGPSAKKRKMGTM